MHIYYATRGLRGRPYHSDMINTDLFAFFQGKRMRTIPSAETLRAVNAFPQCDIDMGEDTDSEYVCEKGTFSIPTSICMGKSSTPAGPLIITSWCFAVMPWNCAMCAGTVPGMRRWDGIPKSLILPS